MQRIVLALLALLFAASLAPAALAQSVGVTAAVNQNAKGTAPGQGIRTIALGDNVIHDERIETDAAGLVQVLLVDGTTLTLGPKSSLVIDSFIYDPEAGTAKLAATMGKGVLRFIGGLASKSEDGVAISTPVGTIGIRGGITDINLNPPAGTPPHIDLLFGRDVTLSDGLRLLGRLYQGGYSLVLGADGQVVIQKTPPGWTSQVQAALAGKPGTSGGSPNQPSDDTVADSGVADSNSASGPGTPPGDGPPLTPEEEAELLAAVAAYDELREFIVDNPPDDGEPPPPPPRPTHTFQGTSAGIVRIDNFDGEQQLEQTRQVPMFTTGESFSTAQLTQITIDDETGQPVAGTIDVTSPASSNCANCRVRFTVDESGTSLVAIDQTGTYQVETSSAHLRDHTAVTLPAGVDYCECAFMHWGFWDFAASFNEPDGSSTSGAIENGVWAVGNLTSPAELDTLGVQELAGTYATYQGHAIGNVSVDGGAPYLAAGGVDLHWSFANRNGELTISDFDGRYLAGEVGASEPGTNGFVGNISDGGYTNGVARGGFVNDGSTPAAGFGGDFLASDGNWTATGVLLGQRGADGVFSP